MVSVVYAVGTSACEAEGMGSTPIGHPRCRRGSTEKGSALVKRLMLVQIQSSALTFRWCSGKHWTLRRSRPWFDSRSGYSTRCLASVMDARWSSEPQDGVRLPGEVLTENMSWECAGFARDPAKVEDQVRFLAGTLLPIAAPSRQIARPEWAKLLQWICGLRLSAKAGFQLGQILHHFSRKILVVELSN